MGLKSRVIPKELPKKLKFIRNHFHLTLEELGSKIEEELKRLGFPDIKVYTGGITEFEQGKREPQLPVLLAYAQIANIYVDILINDDLEIPKKLPAAPKKSFD